MAHFPDDLKPKTKEWFLEFNKAAWSECVGVTGKSFYPDAWKIRNIRDYMQGKQPVNKYKPMMGVDEDDQETWMSIIWNVIPIAPKMRRVALNRIGKYRSKPSVTPIDQLAQNERDAYFKNLRGRMKVREVATKMNAVGVANDPRLMKQPDEPESFDELSLFEGYTYRHKAAVEMEMALQAVFNANNIDKIKRACRADWFDIGVAAVRDMIMPDGRIVTRKCEIDHMVVSPGNKSDFSKVRYVGEVVPVTISEFRSWVRDSVSETELEALAGKVMGKHGNPNKPYPVSNNRRWYDPFKINVLDLEIRSYKSDDYETRYTKQGNRITKKMANPEDKRENSPNRKYSKDIYQCLYECKWVVDTDYVYDYKPVSNMKVERGKVWDVISGYHIEAVNMVDGRIVGYGEQLEPMIDELQVAWYKFQQAIAEARPKGYSIELTALEDIPLGKQGEKLSEADVLKLYQQKGVLAWRRVGGSGDEHWKPIEELENGIGDEAAKWWSVIVGQIDMMKNVLGLNDLTDGSTPDSRTLTTVAQMANESSNNSLYDILNAERELMKSLSKSVIIRVQDLQRMGYPIEGYVETIGKESMNFFRVQEDLTKYLFSVRIDDLPDDVQRKELMDMTIAFAGKDTIGLEEAFLVRNTDNLKQAEMILAHKAKQRRKEAMAAAQQQIADNTKSQMESAAMAEKLKQQTEEVKGQVKLMVESQLEEIKGELKKELEAIKQGGQVVRDVVNHAASAQEKPPLVDSAPAE